MTEPVIPDLISPIVGYRVWKFDVYSKFLQSLNSLVWFPNSKMEANCMSDNLWVVGHNPPEYGCSCGVYAAKSFGQLHKMNYLDDNLDVVWGEVNLWGKVIEHTDGFRAQYAYPRKLIVPYRGFPFHLLNIEGRVEQYAEYGVPLYFKNKMDEYLLWHPKTGIHNIEQLVEMKQASFVKPKIPDLTHGTRVWIKAAGHYAVILSMDKWWVYLATSSQLFEIRVEDMSWDEANNRWSVYTTHYVSRGLRR